MVTIRFDGGSHWYTKTGAAAHDADLRIARKAALYPSVTTIDKDVFKNDFLDRWMKGQILLAAGENPRQPHQNTQQYSQHIYDISMEKSRKAIEFGKKLHEAVEKYPAEPEDSLLLPWFNEFKVWWEGSGVQGLKQEVTLLDHDLGIAGRTDMIGTKGNGLVVWDWKTQDVKVDDKGRKKPVFYDYWVRQLAFYSGCEAKQSGVWPELPACGSLIIDSNEGGKVYEKIWDHEEVLDAYEDFVVGAWSWFRKRNYWPVGPWKVTPDRPMPVRK